MRNPRQAKPVTLATHYFVGAMVLDQVQRGEWPEKRLKGAMDRFLDKDRDRALFGLPATRSEKGDESP